MEKNKDFITELYLNGKPQKDIAILIGVGIGTIGNYLKKWDVSRNSFFSDKEKERIIDIYVNQKRGKSYIANKFNCSDACISRYLKKWGIKSWSRKEIQQQVYKVHGYKSSGFKGKSHKESSKKKISKSLINSYENAGMIERNYPKSLYINTIIGKVLGSYEVAFIYKFFKENGDYPNKVEKRISTPFGTYLPDFEYGEEYYEVKSEYTQNLSLKSNQSKKIKWVNENNKKVNVIILNKKEAWKLFRESISDIVLDNIKIINGNQYEILR